MGWNLIDTHHFFQTIEDEGMMKGKTTKVKESVLKKLHFIHNDISLTRFVIPGLTRNPVFFWIPAFAGMTTFAIIKVAVYSLHARK